MVREEGVVGDDEAKRQGWLKTKGKGEGMGRGSQREGVWAKTFEGRTHILTSQETFWHARKDRDYCTWAKMASD